MADRVPSLVLLCQRAAAANLDATLGHLPFPLVQPILARCSPDQLARFEHASPHLEMHTSDIWRDLCFQLYHLTAAERFSPSDNPHPDSWRSRFFYLQQLEADRIELVGSKIRSQRQEADERKKEKEVKRTDRLPPSKRPRSAIPVSQPKSLFQKTRSEASKIQRALNARILPPPPSRILPGPSLPSAVSPNLKSTSVHHSSSASSSLNPPPPLPPQSDSPRPIIPNKIRSPTKRDPMASLFVPKRKLPPKRPS